MIGALLAIGLLAGNAFFVGAEFAFVTARRAKMDQLAAAGNRKAKFAVAATKELSLMLAGAQLGITMTSIGLGYIAEPAIASLIEAALAPFITLPPGALHTISFTVALSIVLYFHLVLGEHIPKNIAIAKPDASLLWIAGPFSLYVKVLRPFIRLLNGMANTGLRLVRVQPRDELFSATSPSDITTILRVLKKEGVIEEFRHRLLTGTLTFGGLDAESVMVPRTQITAVSTKTSVAQVEKMMFETGRTRLPVFEGDLDHMSGFVHAKDLLKASLRDRERPISRSLVREVLLVPASRKLGDLLADMRDSRRHLAVVIDEHGGTAGIVTLEDVLNEILGDLAEEPELIDRKIRRLSPTRFLMPGKLRPDELEATTGLSLPEGDYETLAGFIMLSLGRFPREGDEVVHSQGILRIRRMTGRKVELVEVLLASAPTSERLA